VITTPLTRWFDLTTPVIGAPMAGVSGGALAHAVSAGGGLGMIGISGSHTPDFVTEQCAIPADAEVPFGVGLMIWVLETRPELLQATIAAQPSLVSVSFGDPAPYVGPLHDAGIAVCTQVNTTADVHRALDAGVDVLVAQGTEAGGHTGTIATTVLTPEIVDVAGDRPVLAAGGIASGDQMAAALALGAAGVWCGSVWLCSVEDVAPESVKRKFLAAGSGDTVRSPARTGKPARQLRSAYHDAWSAPGAPAPLPMPLQPLLTLQAWSSIDAAADAGNPGAQELQSFFVGQVVGAFTELRGAGEITREMARDCEHRIAALAGLVR
jgi:NAD(P)H-dependent flavin oxidoreductase YrpB (nitropropane dioxygenase family)